MNKKYYDKVNSIIKKHDPLGFLASGFPEDEYNLEVQQIVLQSPNKKLQYFEVENIVFFVFKKMFDKETIEGSAKKLKLVSEDIFNLNIE